jgi:hypothetical protein
MSLPLEPALPPDVTIPRTPMRNRVTPTGDIVAIELRGAWLGNRGVLHQGTDVVRFHRSELWITCALEHKDWQLPQWAPGHFTVLFFHDEATALAAGHRPCALCRRDAYDKYRRAWATGNGMAVPRAKEIDRRLHAERIMRGSHQRRLHLSSWPTVPAGAFVLLDGQPTLVFDGTVVPWTIHGYGVAASRPLDGTVELITPPSTAEALRAGYQPQIDAGATTATTATRATTGTAGRPD